jgi:PhnB protein
MRKTMAQLNPYLNFNGKCREAMTFYQTCLGGELFMQKVAESPMSAQMPSEMGANILHSTLTSGSVVMMGSDMMGNQVKNGNSITLFLNCESQEEINDVFAKLAENGQVITPLHQSFWGATYGELTDKYGVFWSFNYARGKN